MSMFWIRHPKPVVSGRAVPEQIVQYQHRQIESRILIVEAGEKSVSVKSVSHELSSDSVSDKGKISDSEKGSDI